MNLRSLFNLSARNPGPLDLWLVGLFVLIGILQATLLPFVLAGITLILVNQIRQTDISQRRTPVDLSVLTLAALLPVNLWVSPVNAVSGEQAARLLTGILLFYFLVAWINTTKRLEQALRLSTLAGVGLGLLAIFTVSWPVEKLGFAPGLVISGETLKLAEKIHPNVLAGNLVLFWPLSLSQVLFFSPGQPILKRIGLPAAAGFILFILLLTKSRGALLAVLLSSAVVLSLRWKPKKPVVLLLYLALLGITIALIWSNWQAASSWMSGSRDVFSLRQEIWSRAIAMVSDFPLTGAGMGMFGVLVDSYYPFFWNAAGSIPHAHNLFLQISADLGVPGLVAWLSILINITAAAWMVFHSSRSNELGAAVGAGLLGCQAALITHGLTDSVVWGMVRAAPLLWSLWALAVAAHKLVLNPSYANPE